MSLRKAKEKQAKKDDDQATPKQTALPQTAEDVSKRELVRRGEYVQLAALVPKDLVKRLKHVVIDADDDKDLSDHVAAALATYLDSLTND